MKIALISLGISFIIGLVLEISFRLRFGFGDPLLYVADEKIGYLLRPNQNIKRSGNHIVINEYSMRGEAIAPKPNASTRRVLLLGDSIVNGGWWTDQADILSARLQQSIAANNLLPPTVQHIEVINASANSWAPRNELAYLQRFGLFNSHTLILVINTDDFFGRLPNPKVVGNDLNYPPSKPLTALEEVFKRYVFPKPKPPGPLPETGNIAEKNRVAIAQIQAIAQTQNCQFILVLTPLVRELDSQGGGRDYEQRERKKLQQLVTHQDIVFIDMLPIFNAEPSSEELFRDNIHLSPRGYALLTQTITKALQQSWDNSAASGL